MRKRPPIPLHGSATLALLACALLLPSFWPTSAKAQWAAAGSRPSDVDQKLADIARRLEQTERHSRDLLELIQESDRRLQELNLLISELEPRVEEARARLGAAQSDLDQASALYLSKLAAVEETEQRYADLRSRVAYRLARAYKDGPWAEVTLFLQARSLAELSSKRTYLDAVVKKERLDQLQLLSLRDRLEAERSLVEAVKDELLARRNDVQATTDEVLSLHRSYLRARELAEKELANHKELLAVVLQDRAQAIRMLDELEGVSEETKQDLLRRASRGDPGIFPGYFIWPAEGEVVSGFGPRKHPIAGVVRQHNGIDIDAPYGAGVRAAANGAVLKAGPMGGYGLAVVIDHGDGLSTLYAHMSEVSVSAGRVVSQGEVIGKVGSTGYSTGPHLHFEVRVNGEPRDPLLWFPERRR